MIQVSITRMEPFACKMQIAPASQENDLPERGCLASTKDSGRPPLPSWPLQENQKSTGESLKQNCGSRDQTMKFRMAPVEHAAHFRLKLVKRPLEWKRAMDKPK